MNTYHPRAHIDLNPAEPDLTPMLDVVFILLIFFIVTATFVQEKGLDLPQKNTQPQTVEPEKSLVLRLKSDNRYYINGQQIDHRVLPANLARLHAESPDKPLIIEPSIDATAEKLVYALDIAGLIGIQVSLADTRAAN